MIIVMNRTVLIPILLSTFLLVGCETELDRCLEANTSGVFDYAQYKEKMSVFTKGSREFQNTNPSTQEFLDDFEKRQKELKLSFNPVEDEFNTCTQEKYQKEYNYALELREDGVELAELLEKVDQEAIANSCLPSTKAKKICNSQGIY